MILPFAKGRMRWRRLLAAGVMLIIFVVGGSYVAAQMLVGATADAIVIDAPSVPVAIVLGASVKPDGSPSDVLADRLRVADRLYDEGKVTKILASGDHGQAEYDEVNAMRRYLLDLGVAPEDIFLDHAGFDTYDTMYRARHVFGVTEAIVVSQEFHLPRALYFGESMGMTVYGVAADLQPYAKHDLFVTRERFANVKAMLSVLFGETSTYSGEAIDISGDGRTTWDVDGGPRL